MGGPGLAFETWVFRLRRIYQEKPRSQRRDLGHPLKAMKVIVKASEKCFPHHEPASVCVSVASLLFDVDGNAGRNAKQVLVVAGKVRQAGISVINLDRAEGEMLSVLYVKSRAH